MNTRPFAGAILILLAVRGGYAQTYTLTDAPQSGDCFRYHIEMSLAGELHIRQNGKIVPLKLEASAAHEFPERILVPGSGGMVQKTARLYEKAQATINAGGEKSERSLRPDRRLCVAQRYKDKPMIYSPAGSLTREELDLVAEDFDTLSLTGLLPAKAVALNETWTIPNAVVQAFCNFGGLTEQTLIGKLDQIRDGIASISISGSASGIDKGALSKLKIEAKCSYYLKSQRLVRLEWQQNEERDQGPVSPALTIQSTVTLTRSPIALAASLTDVALVSVPDGFEPPLVLTQLEYHDPKGRFDLLHAREWETVSQTEDHLVLRLMEQGEFVAQATITPWTPAEKGSHLSPEEFQQAMESTPGWEVDQALQTGQVPSDGGKYIYRISALGQLDGMKIMQNYYLVASPSGQQVVLAFTLTPKQADRLGDRDLSMAANLDFPADRKSK